MKPRHQQLLWAVLVLAVAFAGYALRGTWPGQAAPAPGGGSSGQAPAPVPVGGGGPAPCLPGVAADYFPYQVGTQASYAGMGNEFASYKVKVVHQSGNKVEWRRDTGGTVAAEVFQVTPQQVMRIYREGEAYDNSPRLNQPPNQSEIILKGNIQVGTSWTAGTTNYAIQSVTASVQAMNQTLTCVVRVVAQSPTSTIDTYFHKQYGIVLSVFDPAGNPIESRLAAFSP